MTHPTGTASARAVIPLQRGVVYGPVLSRRLGRSLGLNILPDEIKVCSLDCRYCQYGWTGIRSARSAEFAALLPTRAQVRESLEKVLRELVGAGTPPDTITFSGNGEATLHPEFPEIVEDALALRDTLVPKCRVAILSNATTVHLPKIREALCRLDDAVLKLDAGTPETYQKLNGPAALVHFDRVLGGLREMGRRAVLQALFVTGPIDNSRPEEVEVWLEAVREIGPRSIQIYTLDRGPADASLLPVPAARLNEIARQVREAGMEAEVFA